MTTLLDILQSANVKIDDLDNKENKDDIDLKSIKLEDIPEKSRPIFQKLISKIDNQSNELAKSGLVIETLNKTFPTILQQIRESSSKNTKDTKDESANTDDEKVLGLFDKNDPYAQGFKLIKEEVNSIKNMISGISAEKQKNNFETFKTNLVTFAKDHKDIVKYIKDMDSLLKEYPNMANNIELLYDTAKNVSERRENLRNDKVTDINTKKQSMRFGSERTGTGLQMDNVENYKSISEAFDGAEKSLSK